MTSLTIKRMKGGNGNVYWKAYSFVAKVAQAELFMSDKQPMETSYWASGQMMNKI